MNPYLKQSILYPRRLVINIICLLAIISAIIIGDVPLIVATGIIFTIIMFINSANTLSYIFKKKYMTIEKDGIVYAIYTTSGGGKYRIVSNNFDLLYEISEGRLIREGHEYILSDAITNINNEMNRRVRERDRRDMLRFKHYKID